MSGSWAKTGFPLRVSSIPSTVTAGSGAASAGVTRSMNARCTTGQPTRWWLATSATVRPESATADPSSARSRVVSRARAGIAGSDSVNDSRWHAVSAQRQRRLGHTTDSPAGPCGRSRGRLVTRPFTDTEITPQDGHPAAVSSAVNTCTTRPATPSATTHTTANPSSPNSRLASDPIWGWTH